MIQKMRLGRRHLLEKVHHNLNLLPEELVDRDYLTDSLLNKPVPTKSPGKRSFLPSALTVELQSAFKDFFGFPYAIAVSQGRVAEALAGHLLVTQGSHIPGSALFATTRIHQQLNGGTGIEVHPTSSYETRLAAPFKGNLDLEALERAIESYHARWCPFVIVEPCNNALGGHPISMENMREVSRIAKSKGVGVYLDATRLIENAFHIQEQEMKYRHTSVADIIREFCLYADGCTMSATKDFPTPIGGFFATRDENLYHEAFDFIIGFGSGLSFENKTRLLEALEWPQQAFSLVQERMRRVKLLHDSLAEAYPLVRPCGGHAVFIDAGRFPLDIPEKYHPIKAYLYSIYEKYGIRGAENVASEKQQELGIRLIRFAVSILGHTDESIRSTANDLRQAAQEKDDIRGLEKLGEPPGLTGAFRASFRPVAVRELSRRVLI